MRRRLERCWLSSGSRKDCKQWVLLWLYVHLWSCFICWDWLIFPKVKWSLPLRAVGQVRFGPGCRRCRSWGGLIPKVKVVKYCMLDRSSLPLDSSFLFTQIVDIGREEILYPPAFYLKAIEWRLILWVKYIYFQGAKLGLYDGVVIQVVFWSSSWWLPLLNVIRNSILWRSTVICEGNICVCLIS